MSSPSGVMRLWAAIDLAVTGVLALPPTALWFIETLYQLNGLLGNTAEAPAFAPVQLLFVCLMGGLGVLWALVRLLRPQPFLGRADGWARLWVAGLLAWFVFAVGAPVVLSLFIATELLGAMHQLWRLRGLR